VTTSHEPELTLREGEARDRAFVLALAGGALATTSAPARSWVEAWWASAAVGRFVAELDGEAAGFYLLGFMAGEGGRHLVGEILAIAVHPRAQRRGLARAMLEHAALVVATAEHAAVARALDVQVAAGNDAALALYRSAGFVDVAGAGGRYPDGTPALRLRRAIDVRTG
jgi:ribosomal-protein-alanine N-acetyltransferase